MAPRSGLQRLLPPWTKLSEADPAPNLPISCRRGLISIANMFKAINAILYDAPTIFIEDIWADEKNPDREVIKRARSVRVPSLLEDFTTLLEYLSSDEELRPWRNAADSLLSWHCTAIDRLGYRWQRGKKFALEILNYRNDATIIITSEQKNLTLNGCDRVCQSIIARLHVLATFTAIYNRQPVLQAGEREDPKFSLHAVSWLSAEQLQGSEPRIINDKDPTMIAIISIGITLSFIPLLEAWRKSSPNPGSVQDADFWLLLQNSIMQLLGLIITVYPLPPHRNNIPWQWIQAFTGLGTLAAISAIPTYVLLPVMWSSLFSFVATAAQIFVVMQLAFLTRLRAGKEKKE